MSVPRVRRKAPPTPAEPYGPSHESGRDAHRSVPSRRVYHLPSGCAVPLLSARHHGEYAGRKRGRRVPRVAASRPFASRRKAARQRTRRIRCGARSLPPRPRAGHVRLSSIAATAPALSQPPSKSPGSHASIATTESDKNVVHRLSIDPQLAREFSTELCKRLSRRIVSCVVGQRVD